MFEQITTKAGCREVYSLLNVASERGAQCFFNQWCSDCGVKWDFASQLVPSARAPLADRLDAPRPLQESGILRRARLLACFSIAEAIDAACQGRLHECRVFVAGSFIFGSQPKAHG